MASCIVLDWWGLALFGNKFLIILKKNSHEYTFKKISLKSFGYFEPFPVYFTKNNHEYTFKKIFEAFQFISKIFIGADFEKSREYTFEKIL